MNELELHLDAAGVVTGANPAYLRLAGLGEDALVGTPLSATLHRRMPVSVLALLWENAEAGAPAVAYVPHTAADGRPVWARAELRRTGTGRDTRYRHTAHRVPGTALAEVEDRVERVYADLRGVEAAQDTPSAAVAGGLFRLTDLLTERRLSYAGLVASFDRGWFGRTGPVPETS